MEGDSGLLCVTSLNHGACWSVVQTESKQRSTDLGRSVRSKGRGQYMHTLSQYETRSRQKARCRLPRVATASRVSRAIASPLARSSCGRPWTQRHGVRASWESTYQLE